MAFSLLAGSLLYYIGAPQPVAVVAQRLNSGLESFPLTAVPFFVLAGTAMASGGIASKLLGFADSLVGHRRGGLGQVNVLNSLMMGGMTGSGVADAAIDAKVLVPVMVRNGYTLNFSAALSAATGVIAPIMPPGIALILYGLIARVSIGRLFLAGIIPAFLLAIALSVVVSRVSRARGYGAQREKRLPARQILVKFREASWALLMPVLLVVGLRMGVFTPTELGALAAGYAILVGLFAYREMKIRDLMGVLREAVLTNATVMIILAAGIAFAGAVTVEGIPQSVGRGLISISENPLLFLLIINLVLLFLGMFLDGITLMVVMTPILAPAALAFGIDPIHFGIVMVVNLTIGAMTPPLGLLLFTVCSITGARIEQVSREIIPFFLGCCVALALITYVPEIALFLPRWLMG
jgi:tripartite ATP-independent transporter DctM subunit